MTPGTPGEAGDEDRSDMSYELNVSHIWAADVFTVHMLTFQAL